MKTYLKLLATLFTVVLCVGFTGCSSDDDDEPSSTDLKEQLQGTWVFSTGTIEVMGEKVTYDRDDLNDMAQEMGVSGYYDEVLTFSGNRVNGSAYTLKGNKLHFDEWDDYSDYWPTVKIAGNTLTLVYDMTANGIKATLTVKYKKESSRAHAMPESDLSAGKAGLITLI